MMNMEEMDPEAIMNSTKNTKPDTKQANKTDGDGGSTDQTIPQETAKNRTS